MPAEECKVILGQIPEVVTSFFTGKETPNNYENKFVVAEGDKKEQLIAIIGKENRLYGSILIESGLARDSLRGGAEIHLIDETDGQELVVCKGSLDFGGVKEAIARQIAERIKEVLQQSTAKEITIKVCDLVPPKHPCFFRGKLDGGR
ncbi:hypothetical protein JXD20_00265 [Candidatus Peregrinibacteria bacterium]|nr:hypothetical protein [Candidatus Peregrinibacteria bacterium]